jgi:hypothetical protein
LRHLVYIVYIWERYYVALVRKFETVVVKNVEVKVDVQKGVLGLT